ncbi:MAG: flagellar basal body P-ring formation chaperone FlgA [Candidatus Riflemargulisbacteria bacterium]
MKFKIFAVLFFVFLAVGLVAEGPEVVLKSNDIYIASDKIYLGDIVDFSSIAPKDLEKLQTLYVKRAAVPGFKVVVEKETVQNIVAKAFPYIAVSGLNYVNVYTSKGSVSRDEVENKAKEYVLKNMPWQFEAAEVAVKHVKGSVAVIDGIVLLKVKEDGKFNYKGNLIVPVEIDVDGKFYKIEPVAMLIKVNAPCAVAQNNISRHSGLLMDNIIMETKDITFLPEAIITDIAFFNNKVPLRNIMKGTIVTSDMFESLPLFRRGSLVDVVVKIGTIQVKSEGSALSDGREGDLVKVKLVTGKTVEGKADATGRVIIVK